VLTIETVSGLSDVLTFRLDVVMPKCVVQAIQIKKINMEDKYTYFITQPTMSSLEIELPEYVLVPSNCMTPISLEVVDAQTMELLPFIKVDRTKMVIATDDFAKMAIYRLLILAKQEKGDVMNA
jgi:hypothetical protein